MNLQQLKKLSEWLAVIVAIILPLGELFGIINPVILNSKLFKLFLICAVFYFLAFYALPYIVRSRLIKNNIQRIFTYILFIISFIYFVFIFWTTDFNRNRSSDTQPSNVVKGNNNGLQLNGNNNGVVNIYPENTTSLRHWTDKDIQYILASIPSLTTDVSLECRTDISTDVTHREELKKKLLALGYLNVKTIDITNTNRLFNNTSYSIARIGIPVKQIIVTINPQE